jgi:hypothetical protein
VAVIVQRRGDEYTARVGPPESDQVWETDRPYGRDELRWKIEQLGVHPIDVGDAFYQADLRAGEKPAVDWPPE